jgi:peptidoglycan hydrolase-like protein with peptidoglycan-binding domain
MALSWPLEQQGSTGENVRSIQYLLNARMAAAATTAAEVAPSSAEETSAAADEGTATATLTEAPPSTAVTEAAPPATTTAAKLVVDGIFGSQTAAAVRSFQASRGLQVDGQVGNQTWPALVIQVSSGSSGDAVRAVQSQLHSRSGWLAIDGIFGPQTDSVVRSFQSFCDFGIDGIVGPVTWNGLTLPWVRANGGQPAAQAVFTAWSQNNRTNARYEAIPVAVDLLFGRKYEAGWTFAGCGVAAGTFACTWTRSGGKLILEGNNSTGAPFYYVNNVTSEI